MGASQQIQASKPIQQEEYQVQAFSSSQRCNTSFQSTAYQQRKEELWH